MSTPATTFSAGPSASPTPGPAGKSPAPSPAPGPIGNTNQISSDAALALALMAEGPRADTPSDRLVRLLALPRLRCVELRPGKVVNLSRKTDHEAVLATTRGQVETIPCKRCKNSSGPFLLCITVAGDMNEACSNCHYGSMSRNCSLRPCTYLYIFFTYPLIYILIGYRYRRGRKPNNSSWKGPQRECKGHYGCYGGR